MKMATAMTEPVRLTPAPNKALKRNNKPQDKLLPFKLSNLLEL